MKFLRTVDCNKPTEGHNFRETVNTGEKMDSNNCLFTYFTCCQLLWRYKWIWFMPNVISCVTTFCSSKWMNFIAKKCVIHYA